MKIVQVSPLWASVPPKKYGGTEMLIASLCNRLADNGHEVTLFASGDSKTKAKLIPISKKALYEMRVPWSNYYYSLIEMAQAVEYASKYKFDIIHNHLIDMGLAFSKISQTPIVHTNHGTINSAILPPGKNELVEIFKNDAYFVSISKRLQRRTSLNYIANVYNGIEVDSFKFNSTGGKAIIWVGRFSKEKGAHDAIQISKILNQKILLAGKALEGQIDYFNKDVKSHFNNSNVVYEGEIGGFYQKNKFYAKGKVFLYPISWEEPFGLVISEANACGTPVIAFACGSMPELIKDGFNGYLIKPGDINGMAKAVKGIFEMPEDEYLIMRRNCRKHVENNFTAKKMVDGYEKVYQEVIAKSQK